MHDRLHTIPMDAWLSAGMPVQWDAQNEERPCVPNFQVLKRSANLTPSISSAFMLTSCYNAVSTQQEERSHNLHMCVQQGFINKTLGLDRIKCVIQSAHTRPLAVYDGGRPVYHHVHVLSCLPFLFLFLHRDSCHPQDLKAKWSGDRITSVVEISCCVSEQSLV